MKIFFDTEFQEREYRALDFISLGMVREDGAELYGISNDLGWSYTNYNKLNPKRLVVFQTQCSDWVSNNVGKHLNLEKDERVDLHKIVAFCGESPEFWADYGSYDWVVLCQLFGTMMDLPKGWPMYVNDFQQLLDELPVFEYKDEPGDLTLSDNRKILQEDGPKQDPATLHHALHDARHLKAQYCFIQSRL